MKNPKLHRKGKPAGKLLNASIMLVLCFIFFITSKFHGFGKESPAKKSRAEERSPKLPLFAIDPSEVRRKRKKKRISVYDQKYTLLRPSKMLCFDLTEDYEKTRETCRDQ